MANITLKILRIANIIDAGGYLNLPVQKFYSFTGSKVAEDAKALVLAIKSKN